MWSELRFVSYSQPQSRLERPVSSTGSLSLSGQPCFSKWGWTWGGDRREGTRWGPCHTQAGWSEPLPDSWDQFGQNSRLCEAKAQGSSLGWKYNVNITIQSCRASGVLGKCQGHCTKSLSASIGKISGALTVLMLKRQGKLGQVELLLEWVSEPVWALLRYTMLCSMVVLMFFCCLVKDTAICLWSPEPQQSRAADTETLWRHHRNGLFQAIP